MRDKRTGLSTTRLIFIEQEYYGGRGNWDRELIKRLAQQGYEVHAIARPFPVESLSEEDKWKSIGVCFHRVKWRNRVLFGLGSLFNFCQIVCGRRAVVWTASIRLIPFLYPFARLFGTRIVFSLQGAPMKELEVFPRHAGLRQKRLRFWFRRVVARCCEKTSAKLANRTIAISAAIRDELSLLGEEQKTDLVYYCVDKNEFKASHQARLEIRGRLGIARDDVVLTYVGRLSFGVPEKLEQAEMLLDMLSRRPEVKALIIGGGDAEHYLSERARALGIADRVVMTGFIAHSELPAFLSAADVFFFVLTQPLPTYGLALLEAMSCGLIVLTNDSETQMEIVTDGVNGFLVEPDTDRVVSKLGKILDLSRADLDGIRRRARESIERTFCWEVILPQIVDIIEGRAGSRAGGQ